MNPRPMQSRLARLLLWLLVVALLGGCNPNAGSTSAGREERDPLKAAASADVVVASDGSEACRTISEAVRLAPAASGRPFVIRVRPGIYREKLKIQHKGPISLVGEDAATTVVVFDDYAARLGADGKPLGTANSYTARISSDNFLAENITFRNSHSWEQAEGQQALALSFAGDRAIFRKCRFESWQDTLYLERNRQYFEDCQIAGNVDFIFGGATAFFERCELRCVGPGIAITAASTPADQPYGFVFSKCRVLGGGTGKTHLGRPWRPHAHVVFLDTHLADIIAPAGWHNWDNPANEKTARFAEHGSVGPGAGPTKQRVSWAQPLTPADASRYTAQRVLSGKDGWHP